MDVGKDVIVVEGEHKGKVGIIVDEYSGWMFYQYTIKIKDTNEEIVLYHDAVKILGCDFENTSKTEHK